MKLYDNIGSTPSSSTKTWIIKLIETFRYKPGRFFMSVQAGQLPFYIHESGTNKYGAFYRLRIPLTKNQLCLKQKRLTVSSLLSSLHRPSQLPCSLFS